MGAAQTGTGKTAAFSLPLLQRMLKHENASTSPARHPVRALVLLPTRELADQVANSVKAYAKHTNLRSAVVFGGIDMKPQTLELKAGVEVLVATPGRLLDHIEAKNAVLEPGRVRGARRGRPHARHRLPARPAAHPELPAQAAPDAAVLGHVLARDQAPGRQLPAGPDDRSRWRGRTPRPPTSSSTSTASPTTTSAARVMQIAEGSAASRRRSSSSTRKLGCARLARSLRARRPAHHRAARRQVAGRAPEGARRVQEGRGRRAGRAPTSPPAASTSSTCRPSSTSTCRSTPRTTCTASAAPAAPAPRAWPSRFVDARRRAPGRRHREADQARRSSSSRSSSTKTARAAASTTDAATGAKKAKPATHATCSTSRANAAQAAAA